MPRHIFRLVVLLAVCAMLHDLIRMTRASRAISFRPMLRSIRVPGGPLVNAHGELVGINTFIISDNGSFAGAGFAIPSRIVRASAESMIKDGKVDHGYLGIGMNDVTPDNSSFFNLPDATGAIVSQVTPDSPAGRAGLKSGDVLRELNGSKIVNGSALQVAVSQIAPGNEIKLGILRDWQLETIDVKVGEFKGDKQVADNDSAGSHQGGIHPIAVQRAAAVDGPLAVADHDLAATHRLQQAGNRRAGDAGPANDHPDIGQPLGHDPELRWTRPAPPPPCRADRHERDGDLQLLDQLVLDIDAARRGDVFQIDAAEGGDTQVRTSSSTSWGSRQMGKASTPPNSNTWPQAPGPPRIRTAPGARCWTWSGRGRRSSIRRPRRRRSGWPRSFRQRSAPRRPSG